jgi:erythromycin esterase
VTGIGQKQTVMKRTSKRIFYLLSALLFTNLSLAHDTAKVVIAWLKQNSIPIKYREAGNGFSDLQPLKKILQDVQVVGLGEATHGTQEFFKVKHRLVEFMVTQVGFTAFALESSYSNCQPINDYILMGKGDRNAVLTGQGYMAWDTEEFSAMLDWMRAYNQRVSDEKKVRFYGIDVLSFQGVGREKALAYIQKYAPEKAASTDSLIRILATEENNWPSRLNQSVLQSAFMPLHELISYFTVNKNKLVASSSLNEWEQVYKYLEVMEQGLYVNVKDAPSALSSKKQTRDEYQAQNFFYIMGKERPGTKFMVWQHNWHIANRPEDTTLGSQLKQRLGDRYYALGLECYEGTFQARVLMPDSTWGDLKADTLLPVEKSLAWYLASTSKKSLFINFRNTYSNPVVDKWMNTPIRFNDGHWLYRNASENFDSKKLKDLYDGILFMERSTPVHPTKNAIERSSRHIGF